MTGSPRVGRSLIDIYPAWGPRRMNRLPEGVEPEPYTLFDLRPMGPVIGAEIHGLDVSVPLGEKERAEVSRALLEWKVLVFVGQDLDGQAIDAFARQWGDPYDARLLPENDDLSLGMDVSSKPHRCSGDQNYWHADDTYMAVPGKGSVLRIVDVPGLGGDTMFADMAVAYDNLDDGMKARIAGLRAVHDCAPYAAATPHYRDHLDEITRRYPPVDHPVVRTLPETGRKVLYVNAMWTRSIVGLPQEESDALLLHLTAQATVPEYQCRVHWGPGKLLFWDNRAVQHYAVSDYAEPRSMLRSTLRGDGPPE